MFGKMNWLWTLLVPLLVLPAFAEIIELSEAPAPGPKDGQMIDHARKWPGAFVKNPDGSFEPAEVSQEFLRSQELNTGHQVNELDELVFNESFEGTFPPVGWWTNSDVDRWDISTYRFSDGSQSIWCVGFNTAPGNNYPGNVLSSTEYGPIDLSAYDNGTFYWDQWFEIEPGYDGFFVGVSADGSNYNGFWYDGLQAAWDYIESIDITPYCGGDLYIMFRFMSDSIVGYEGVYVDNVNIYAYNDPIADLYISDVSHSPVNPVPGQTVTTSVTVMNDGPEDSESFFIDLFTNQNDAPTFDGPYGDLFTSVPFLVAGGSHTEDFTYSYPDPGVKHVWAIVDLDETQAETNENNNVFGIHDIPVGVASVITVTPAVTPVVIPPSGGTFNYSVSAVSYGNLVQRDGWISVTFMPTGTSQELLNVTANFNPANPITLNRSQFVPSVAPPGMYKLSVSVGSYPWVVHDSGYLYFTKQAAVADGANQSQDLGDASQWISGGDFFKEADEMSVSAAEGLPTEFKLTAPTPNPFNPTAQLSVQLPSSADLSVDVYDINGRLVSQLVRGTHSAGSHTFTLDGSALSSGVYFVRAATDAGETMVQKAILMK